MNIVYNLIYMKKIFFGAMLLCAMLVGFTSCNLDRPAYGNKEQAPFESFRDATLFRESLYALMRSSESNSNLNTVDIMADLFNVPNEDGNTYTPFSTWSESNLEANDAIASYYASFYRLIMQCNYFIQRVEELQANKDIKIDKMDKDELPRYIAEAKVMIAEAYYRLMLRFSKAYDKANAKTELGVVLLKKYDYTNRDARASQFDVYDYCLNTLLKDDVINALVDGNYLEKQDGKPIYMIKDYAYAVKARILTEMGENKQAIATIQKFIDKYPLTETVDLSTIADPEAKEVARKSNLENLKKVYTYENSSEIMFKFYSSINIGAVNGGLHGGYTRALKNDQVEPRFNPSLYPNQWVIDLYGADDLRKGYYVSEYQFYNADVKAYGVTKFKGNPRLDRDDTHPSFLVSVVPYRIAEAYLTLAENQAKDGDAPAATATLEKFRKSRGIYAPISGVAGAEEVLDFVLDEKVREMIGEGIRLNDLKRHHKDMDRSTKQPQPALNEKVKGEPAKVVKAGHKMFVWEFPLRDRQANTNLKANWK